MLSPVHNKSALNLVERKIFIPAQRKELVFATLTKQKRGWEIERNLKIMNLTCFHHKKRVKHRKQKQQPSQHQICCLNIRHQKFIWKQQIWC